MKVVIIGAGVLGITSAFYLRQYGMDVTVLDSESEPAMGASYGNGGYYQTSAPDPWNAPGVIKMFQNAWRASLSGKGDKSAFAARTLSLPGLTGWGIRFLRSANLETFQRHLLKNKELADYTRTVVEDLNEHEPLDYAWSGNGALIVFRDAESMADYVGLAQYVGQHGARYEVLDRGALLSKEPSLNEIIGELEGAVYFPDDSAGNPHLFCTQLAEISEKNGATFHYDTTVVRIAKTRNGVRIETKRGDVAADAVVVAAGAWSKKLVSSLGIRLPIAPAKGYSISVPMREWTNRPRHVIADMGPHAGVNPLGDTLRVAGTAEFAGMRPGITATRTEYLIDLVRQIFPTFAETIDPTEIDPWGGHRPLSADGIPIIGKTQVDGVYVNTGHGGLGWTQAAGSSKALADHIAGVRPDIDLDSFSLMRF